MIFESLQIQANILSHAIGKYSNSYTKGFSPRGNSVNCVRSQIFQIEYVLRHSMVLVDFLFGLSKCTNRFCFLCLDQRVNTNPSVLRFYPEIPGLFWNRLGLNGQPTELCPRPIQFTFQGIQQQIHLSEIPLLHQRNSVVESRHHGIISKVGSVDNSNPKKTHHTNTRLAL